MSWNHFRKILIPKNALLSGANSPNLNRLERFRRTMPPTGAVGGIVWPSTFVELRFCEFAPESRAFLGVKKMRKWSHDI